MAVVARGVCCVCPLHTCDGAGVSLNCVADYFLVMRGVFFPVVVVV